MSNPYVPSSNFGYVGSGAISDGHYTVMRPQNVTSSTGSSWWADLATDHSGDPTGALMVLNAGDALNEFYVRDFTLQPGHSYRISAWRYVVNGNGGAGSTNPISWSLQVRDPSTNTTEVESGDLPSTQTQAWFESAYEFTVPVGCNVQGAGVQARLALTNRSAVINGNDFYIDDISVEDIAHNDALDQFCPLGQAYTCTTPTTFIAQGAAATQLAALVSASGSSSFTNIGSASPTKYNAIGYNTSDNYIYGVNANKDLVKIDPGTGAVTDLGAITGLAGTTTGLNAGAFDGAGNFYAALSSDTTHVIYQVDLGTLAATQIPLSNALGTSDFAYSNGYFWGVPDSAGQGIRRIDPATGTVATFPATFLPAASAYGGAWTYGNGNIGFSNNDTGRVYQIAIADPSGTPTFTLVSSISGPSSTSNDGTACSLPTDLAIAKTGSATVAPGGALSWTLTVTNNGSGASSGFVVTDTVPAGVTNVASSTAGCAILGSTVTCVGDALAVGASAAIEITGNAPDPFTACITNSASVLGNEADPSPANDSASFQTCPPGSSASITTTKVLTAINGAPPAAGQPVDAGDELTYTITSTNAGQAAGATTLTETVPANTTYTGPDASAWTGCAPGAASPTQCTTVQNVPANGSASTTFTVRADQPLASGTREITNVVTSSADPVCAACSVTVPVAPVSAASITTRKVLTAINGAAPAAGQQVNGGDVLTYTITSTNAGQTAGATTLTETVPASVRYVGPDSGVWSGCASGAANPAQCTTVQNVPANGSTSTTFTVRADQPLASGTRSITNVVTSSADPACAACTATVPAADAQPGADPIPVPVNSTWMLALLGLCLVAVGGGMAFRQRR